MVFPNRGNSPDVSMDIRVQTPPRPGRDVRSRDVLVLILACLVVLGPMTASRVQAAYDDETLEQLNRPGLEQIDRLNHALHRLGQVFLGLGVLLLVVVALKMIRPLQAYSGTKERLLKRAVRDVDELLKRIQAEAEAEADAQAQASANPKKEATGEGLLAGMAEVAEFAKDEQVPSYVLTVNDLMLDNIRVTLKKLRRFKEGDAKRYTDYMFLVLKGIKAITEQSAEAGMASSLAVDVREYFRDDRRYRAWRRLLSHSARRGDHRELAQSFVLFMRNLKEGKPLVASPRVDVAAEEAVVASTSEGPAIPDILNEETLGVVQRAAVQEAGNALSLFQTGGPSDKTWAWQYEFVGRQKQIRLRDEAQRMLSVFLSCEGKTLREITKIKMLPCRTWGHVLRLLGVESGAQLRTRVEDRLLTIQEIIILQKAFLQTLARRTSLRHVYGQGEDAELMIDAHIPEMRRETLALLRRLHQTELRHLDRATDALNEEETPQNSQVRRLIEHYVHHGHNPPGIRKNTK